jgi:hypothetical protein
MGTGEGILLIYPYSINFEEVICNFLLLGAAIHTIPFGSLAFSIYSELVFYTEELAARK